MSNRKASIKETGEELSPEEWERFDAAVAAAKRERPNDEPFQRDTSTEEPPRETERPGF